MRLKVRVAVIGSRSIDNIDIGDYMPYSTEVIVSGGALGIDFLAEKFADKHKITKEIFLPDFRQYKRGAPLRRNKLIVDNADYILAFWDGKSKGTKYTIDYAKKSGKRVSVYMVEDGSIFEI